MAKNKNSQQVRLFKQLIAQLEPDMQAAFQAALDDLRQGIDWQALLQALETRDIEAAIAALQIDAGAFAAYQQATTVSFQAGGVAAATTINPPPRGKVVFRFDMSNPRAEEWISKNGAGRVVEVTEEIKEAARQVIVKGYARGAHPDSIALDIGGRMLDGKRQGGSIGLTSKLQEHVDSMRARLESGNRTELAKIKSMSRRDKRFDALIDAAIEGRELKPAQIDRMIARYEDRLKAYRAERIARTETGIAVMSGRREEWKQASEKLGYDPSDAVIKTWVYGGGAKDQRPVHVALNGVKVIGLDATFKVDDVEMLHALDPAGGAKQCAFCTCDTRYQLDHSAGLT